VKILQKVLGGATFLTLFLLQDQFYFSLHVRTALDKTHIV